MVVLAHPLDGDTAMRMLVCHVGWMPKYQGGGADDEISGGGNNPVYHEIYNFKRYRGQFYGFVQPATGGNANGRAINLDRLGGPKGTESVDKVLVVWTALHPRPGVGVVVVGWYKDATVRRSMVKLPRSMDRFDQKGKRIYNNVTCRERDATLLPLSKRTLPVPRGKGLPGQCHVWFAIPGKLSQSILALIQSYA